MPFSSEPCPARCRVAIIGGGPAASVCALALAQRGVTDVLMLESGDYSQFRIGESIPPESRRVFQALEIDAAFLQQGHAPCYGSCSYWGSDKRGYNDSLLNPRGHGWHLDRRNFNLFLAAQAQQRGVRVINNIRLLSSQAAADGTGFLLTLVQTSAGQLSTKHLSLEADFVIDASGARSLFARQRGSQKQESQPLVCLAARFAADSSRPQAGLTHLEAVEQGWWYGAQLPDASLLLTFYSDAPSIKALRAHEQPHWFKLLAAARNTDQLRNGAEMLETGLMRFPAPSQCLDSVSGPNWLAIGDAASTYDPITSQGIIKAMSNGLLAADTVAGRCTPAEYGAVIKAEYRRYLEMRRYFYKLEQRWPDAPFWHRLQSAVA